MEFQIINQSNFDPPFQKQPMELSNVANNAIVLGISQEELKCDFCVLLGSGEAHTILLLPSKRAESS